jgi:pre-rRNA-processing protein TSR3
LPALYAVLLEQDDPRKCTARKLIRFGLVKPLRRIASIPKHALVLDPFDQPLYPGEVKKARAIVVVDGSWKASRELFFRPMPGIRRRLPLLLAGNPIHYAQAGLLSSAEALAATLYIGGYVREAERVLSLFKWGETFLTLNREPLKAYLNASSRHDILALESMFFPSLV